MNCFNGSGIVRPTPDSGMKPSDKRNLVNNLITQGQSASMSDTVQTLISKVLNLAPVGKKYGAGDTLKMQNTLQKTALLQTFSFHDTTNVLENVIGEDSTYIYMGYVPSSSQTVAILNKSSGAIVATSAVLIGIPLNAYSVGDGYVYVLTQNYLYKIKIADGSIAWSKALYSSAQTGYIRVVGSFLYAVYYNNNGAFCYYESIQLTGTTTYTAITSIQIYSNGTYGMSNLIITIVFILQEVLPHLNKHISMI
ncbi:hypothetical protein ACJDU8_01940 [Clostridium sp. WILCCON 0269]|uniref:Uncharacterized protein n=1 Tax=Candidatus Clostridium eludens TaxID=3381663 RepID=A0ABW8SG88_9CLOT